ncbi:o-succinylbenzoate synthase [Oligoflexia bacterium]|nr:o-succinylbenzoate synthase [Oligoflexia bacterium]
MSFEIEEITVWVVKLPQREPFKVGFGTIADREQIIVQLRGQGLDGWGEAAVLPVPFYNHETPGTALHILKDYVIPLFFKEQPGTPQECNSVLSKIVGHPFARAGIEMAYWDWYAKSQKQPLWKTLGSTRDEIEVGVVVPLYEDREKLYDSIARFLEQGYHRIKVKIAPGQDVELIDCIFSKFGQIPLMVDANAAYTLDDIGLLQRLDAYDLMMIEQPLRGGDLLQHAKLQREMSTAICLDESIASVHDASDAIELKSCKVINIKPGRVGGLTEAKMIHDLAERAGIGVWCGGMLETGIGRAINMSVATLPNFIYPGDISESARYFEEDLVEPGIVLSERGTLKCLDQPGLGFEVSLKRLEQYATHRETFSDMS